MISALVPKQQPLQVPFPGNASPCDDGMAKSNVTLSATGYAFLQDFIKKESGIVLDDSKHYLLEARLRAVLAEHQLNSLDSLVTELSKRPVSLLSRQVVDAMTTNETLFFRDAQLFDALKKEILPEQLSKTKGKRKLRVWSAASSSGQEAYSLAMLLMDMGYSHQDVEIFGTDLCTNIVDRARKGRYVQFEVNRGLPPTSLVRYFKRVGLDWQIDERAQRFATFERRDLRDDHKSLGQFDLIFCRNVLIYFDQATKTKIIQSLSARLQLTGCLILGCAETLLNMPVTLSRRVVGTANFYCPQQTIGAAQ